jgi:diguanylate cyclase (GGDEF)-like protein
VGAPLSIAIVDLDHFKVVNDELGHPVGDHALRQTAAVMRRNCRPNDLVARIGGEEFALILPGLDRADAAQFCESLRAGVANHDWREIDAALAITVSVGVAQWDGTSEIDELVHIADTQLYRAKRAGRNQVA